MILALIVLASQSSYAHKGGHKHKEYTEWMVTTQSTPITASYLMLKENIVYLETEKGAVVDFPLSVFTSEKQALIVEHNKNIERLNHANETSLSTQHKHSKSDTSPTIFFALKGLLIVLSLVFFIMAFKYKRIYSLWFVLAVSAFISVSCNNNDDDEIIESVGTTTVPANSISKLQSQFGHFSDVSTSSDDTYFYVSSTGIPEHNMMVGITSWQQQVPIPQNYTGTNSWAIPLEPALSDNPLSTTDHFLKGAIAIAVNGVPIFNPLNNRGEDALEFGELDNWGGHCGKADDYHYHIPPTHLEPTVGSNQPIAYALDGFPIYGETSEALDEYLGILNEDGSYQYHTTSTFPYFMAGMRGVVSLDPNTTAPEDQVLPQAMTTPLRNGDYGPLNGAEISNYSSTGVNAFSLQYEIGSDTYYTNYSWDSNNLYTYIYEDPNGNTTTETYQK